MPELGHQTQLPSSQGIDLYQAQWLTPFIKVGYQQRCVLIHHRPEGGQHPPGALLLRNHPKVHNLAALRITPTAQARVASRQRQQVHLVKHVVLRADVAQRELLTIAQQKEGIDLCARTEPKMAGSWMTDNRLKPCYA